MLPGARLIQATTLWSLLGLAASFYEPLRPVWVWAGIGLAATAIADALLLALARPLEFTRTLPGRLALGVEQEMEVTLRNTNRTPAHVRVIDGLPTGLRCEDWPWSGVVAGGGFCTVAARVRPLERGSMSLEPAWIEHRSPLSLWLRPYRAGQTTETRVYPNYEPVIRFALLGMQHREAQMGIRLLNKPGQSRDFRQLRDYMDGDPMNTMDWKATSRRLTLTSREFEEQRNQTVILMADCGRRLRAIDGDVTQFDHVLNAMLLLSFIALRQGDRVGVMGWGDEARWLPPQVGTSSMPVILNHLYDYHPGSAPGDIGEAVSQLQSRQPRRSLVIVCTNLRSEDHEHLLKPLQLLRRKHLVVLATLRETEVSARMEAPVETPAQAQSFAATAAYVEDRRILLNTLRSHGILTLDVPPRELPAALGNAYLDIKQQGIL